jgi:3-hydroxyacyl-[acyl-carrier-protein] dehydratase
MDIKELIPQREPFLFIANIVDINKDHIIVDHIFKEDLDVFKGHFPGDPIVPGVLLSEHCFQSGAALISSQSSDGIVRPNEKIKTKTIITEQISNAAFFKSIVTNEQNKKVLIIEFACTLVSQ